MNQIKEPDTSIKMQVAQALLSIGMIISILCFAGSLFLGLLYVGVYFLVLIAILVIIGVIFVAVGGSLFYISFIIAFFAVLFGAKDLSFLGELWPSDWQELIPPELVNGFGKFSLYYLIGIPILMVICTSSLLAMIFAIIALTRLNKAKTKAGGVVGGVFAILSSIINIFSLIEFAGGIMMFVIPDKEYREHNPKPEIEN